MASEERLLIQKLKANELQLQSAPFDLYAFPVQLLCSMLQIRGAVLNAVSLSKHFL